jgi:PhnB protein
MSTKPAPYGQTGAPPAGYHTITPSIIVRDAAAAIDFYVRAFGAEEIGRMPAPDGSIMHAEIRIGDSLIMLGEESEQWGTRSPLSTNGNPGSLHIYVDDADAAFARALEAGATTTYPLENAFWGDRYGKVKDPFGHEWGIATRVKELTPEEMQQAATEWMATAAQRTAAPEVAQA